LPPTPSPMPAIEHYRDLSSLDHLIASKPGMFWCYSHLADLPLAEQSPDPRYCQRCYAFLMAEYRDLLTTRGKRKLWWVPANRTGRIKAPDNNAGHKKTPQLSGQGTRILATSKDENSTIPRAGQRRKPHPPPVQLIGQLSFDGMRSRAKAATLRAKQTLGRRLRKVVPV